MKNLFTPSPRPSTILLNFNLRYGELIAKGISKNVSDVFSSFRCKNKRVLIVSIVIFVLCSFHPFIIRSQSIAPCAPSPNTDFIFLSNMFNSGNNTSGKLLAYKVLQTPAQPLFILQAGGTGWWFNNFNMETWLNNVVLYINSGGIPISGNPFASGNTNYNGFTAKNYIATQNLGEVFIDGDFIIDENLAIQYTEIKMGPNARIIIRDGKVLTLSACWLHACSETTPMWKGIVVEEGGFLKISGDTKIEDALTGVECRNNSFLDVNQSIFNKNDVGVRLNGPVINGTFLNGATTSPVFERVSFTCVDPSCLTPVSFNPSAPYLPATLNAPLAGLHSKAGIVVNDMSQAHMPRIGLTTVGQSENYFVNLDVGIKGNNSYVNILNSRFFDIQPDPGFMNPEGIAIKMEALYPTNTLVATIVKCFVGDDLSATINDRCFFENCRTGIKVNGSSDVYIVNNEFVDEVVTPIQLSKIRRGNILVKGNEIYNFTAQGVRITDCINNLSLSIFNNHFSLPIAVPSLASKFFEETGIYIVNTPIGYSGANIFNNYFENLRFGIYGNGIASARITNNEMLYNKIWTLMQGKLHAGIWLDYSDDVQIYTNLVEYNSIEAAAVPAGATIAQDVRGLILKSVTNSKVISNVIKQTGRPIRCVDNMLLTKFYCNTYDGCFDAWQFSNVDFTTQGGIGFPVSNVWKNYPRTNSTATNKLSGYINTPKDYFYSPVTAGSSTQIPFPNGCFNLTANSTSGNGPCYNQQLEDDWEEVLDYVLNDSIYFANDSLLAEERRRWTACLSVNDSLLQIPDYNLWYQQMEGSESRTYANLTDPNYNRYLIIESLQQLTSFRLPEYELKRDLYVHALANQMSDEEEAAYDTLQLDAIAYTSAWLGTSAVFLVRGLLERKWMMRYWV